MGKARRLDFTIAGDRILSLFLASTKNGGLSMGFTDPSFRNLHLTVYRSPKDGCVHAHINDPAGPRFLWSSQISPEYMALVLAPRLAKWVVSTSHVQTIYVPRERLKRKLVRIMPRRLTEFVVAMPIEASQAKVRMDLRNPIRWRRLNPKEFIDSQEPRGFCLIGGRLKQVFPLPGQSSFILTVGERQFQRYWTSLGRLLGIHALL